MTSSPRDDDPYLWLEEIDGTSALDFVRAENARTLESLAASEDFARIRTEVREVLDSPQRIAVVEDWSGQLYNFWQDRDHPRGLWRRTSWTEYKKAEPAWDRRAGPRHAGARRSGKLGLEGRTVPAAR